MNILVIGGCGYVGTMLTMDLIEKKHNVTVLDAQWFGNYLPKKNPQLKKFRSTHWLSVNIFL